MAVVMTLITRAGAASASPTMMLVITMLLMLLLLLLLHSYLNCCLCTFECSKGILSPIVMMMMIMETSLHTDLYLLIMEFLIQ